MAFLTSVFFLTALAYAMVGFGGGSTYNALLILGGVDYRLVPIIALSCNIIVVSGGVFHFARQGHIGLRRAAPWLISSIPAAFLGGLIPVPEHIFILLLGLCLLAAGGRILWRSLCMPDDGASDIVARGHHAALPLFAGAGLGLVAGITGIGGGIFLAPILYLLRWDGARAIAGLCALFILVNSLAGLAGQLVKAHDLAILPALWPYLPLGLAVAVGGQIGSWLGASRLRLFWIERLTGVLILYVALRLLWQSLTY